MKKSHVVWLLASGCLWMAYSAEKDREFERAILHGAEACFSLRVIDDFGQPVAGANVYTLLDMNFREKANFVDGCTSTNGELRIAGKTTGNEIEFKISKNGYYSSSLSMSLITRPGKEKVRDGKWQPWEETIVMRLRKVHNPILQGDQLMSLRAPATNSWIGLDLKLADWVKPFGKGEISNVELNVLWDGLPPDKSKLCIYNMRVCGRNNGLYWGDKISESEYAEAFAADIQRVFVTTNFVYEYYRKSWATPKEDFWDNHEAIFRLRTITNDRGGVLSANYASIRNCAISPGTRGRGALIELRRVFNPTPNDTNLESKR